MVKELIPSIVFLGVCEKAELIKQGHFINSHHNIIGLNNNLFSYIFPFNLKGQKLIFSFYNPQNLKNAKIKLFDSDNKNIMAIDVGLDKLDNIENINSKKERMPQEGYTMMQIEDNFPTGHLMIYDIGIDIIRMNPEKIKIVLEQDKVEIPIGILNIHYSKAPPFNAELIAAIKSDPVALKTIVLELGCKKCNNILKTYAGLDKNKKLESNGTIWFKELPNQFKCNCGLTIFDLKYIRENLHAFLSVAKTETEIKYSSVRLYTNDKLNNIIYRFEKLINDETNEEEIHKFIKNELLILQSFSPKKIFSKIPILTDYVTDFCVVNNKNDLLLIEIEKANTPLMKKDGGMRSEMVHAIDQVRDWLHEIRDNKQAILKAMKLKIENINMIKGVVILGRDKDYDKEKLRKLKSKDFGEVTFYTYDDILNGLKTTVNNINNI